MAKAIISSTYDDNYFYFIPLVTWLWNRLGVEVICFVPANYTYDKRHAKLQLLGKVLDEQSLKLITQGFSAPEHKEATYAQCSRLYGACLDLPEDEVLITSDVDMIVFKVPPYENNITVLGSDLVPEGQFPICFATGTVKDWRQALGIKEYVYDKSIQTPKEVKVGSVKIKTYQECLDGLLGEIQAEHFRGNYWGKDQETLWLNIKDSAVKIPRARPGTQFASHRVDRDDINWRAYVNDELVDAHLWRPGYTDENFSNILELLTMKYPQEDFTWLIQYNEQYKKML